MDNLGPLDRCQVGGCCSVYAVLSCIRELLRQDNDDRVPSLQDPIGCCLSKGNSVDGWKVADVLLYVLTYGLPLESDYPFTGDVDRCFWHKPRPNQDPIPRRIHIGSYKVSRCDNKNVVQDLRELVKTHGAVVASIFVGEEFGGVNQPPKLDADGIFVDVKMRASKELGIFGHAVLLTDHDEIKGRGCWKARNWYGPGWGDQGYIKIDDKCTPMFDSVASITGASVSEATREAELDDLESAPNSPDAWQGFVEEFSSMGSLYFDE